MNYIKKLNMIVLLLAVMITTINAQVQTNPPNLQGQGQQLYQEYAQLNQQLQQLQQQALEDTEIKEMTVKFADRVEEKMIEQNPEVESTINKRENIVAQFEAAQQAGNQEKLNELKTEYQQVAQELQPVQQKVMQQEALQSRAQEIESALRKKMEQINPKTPELIARLNTIRAQLQQMQQGGQGQ